VEVEVLGKHCHCDERRNQNSRAINPGVVQLLGDATDQPGGKVRIIFETGQSMPVEGGLDDIARKLS
jgi:hypothetical protein